MATVSLIYSIFIVLLVFVFWGHSYSKFGSFDFHCFTNLPPPPPHLGVISPIEQALYIYIIYLFIYLMYI